MISRIKIKKTLFPTIKSFFSEIKKKEESIESDATDALVETKESVRLMEDTYEKIKM